jgi:hypothetical protein
MAGFGALPGRMSIVTGEVGDDRRGPTYTASAVQIHGYLGDGIICNPSIKVSAIEID